jgi:tetratricopeptide (TPR) repeat protein
MKIFLPLLLTAALVMRAAFAQLPAVTHDADDHTAQNAYSQQVSDAEHSLESGDTSTAQHELTALAADHPHDAQVQYDLGFAAEANGDDVTAKKAYEAATVAAPHMAEPHVALGLLELRVSADSAQGIQQLRDGAAVDAGTPAVRARAYRVLAALDEHKAPEQARSELLAAIRLSTETPADVVLGGDLARDAGDLDDAAAAYRRALAFPEVQVHAVEGLADVLRAQGRGLLALQDLKDAYTAHPGDTALGAELASVEAASGDSTGAITLLQKLLAQAPAQAQSALARELAHLYVLNGDAAHAEPLYKALISATPGDPALLDEYGSVLIAERRYAEAQSVFTRAVSQRAGFGDDKAWAECEGHLAFAAQKNGQPAVALQALAARVLVIPSTAATLFLSATAHDSLHQYKAAIADYNAFLSLAANNTQYANESFEARHRIIALERMQ